jgi:hypothetical protein
VRVRQSSCLARTQRERGVRLRSLSRRLRVDSVTLERSSPLGFLARR